MSFSQSLAGMLSAAMKANPYTTGAAVFGLGAATYAGITTGLGTEGTLNHRVDEGASSAMGYGMAGMAVAGTGMTLASIPFVRNAVQSRAGSSMRSLGSSTSNYGRTLASELASGGWKSTLTRAPVVMGAGAGIGALVGAKLNHDDPRRGAMIGSATGAVGGLVASRAVRAVSGWNKMSGLGKFGFLAAAAVAVGGAASAAMPARAQYEDTPDQYRDASISGGSSPMQSVSNYAGSDSSGAFRNVPLHHRGVRARMTTIAASGDLVFGLHNNR